MIEFHKYDDILLLQYSPENGSEWLYNKLEEEGYFVLKNTFLLKRESLYGSSRLQDHDYDLPVDFVIAHKIDRYYKMLSDVLSIDFNLYIHENVTLEYRTFTAEKNVSVFSRVNELHPGDIYIGGDNHGCLPEKEFYYLIKNFPNSYELKKYVIARVSGILRNYFDINIDGEHLYRNYMVRKESRKGRDIAKSFKEYEVYKFTEILNKLQSMLKESVGYTENQWRLEIMQIILLVYPKYIHVFKEVPVKSSYHQIIKYKRLDCLLVDSSGNIDVVEVKQPFDECIVTNSQYRNNHIPLRELSGTVMQVEKYIYFLNRWGYEGENYLSDKYRDQLPSGFKIKITNPGGIIVMGRDHNMSSQQKQDFEIIRRKYNNVIDIITYDDLLRRLRFTIEQLNK